MKEFNLFSDIFSKCKNKNRIAIVYNNIKYTYGELQKAIDLCASDLIKMGLKKGDHVALWSYNSANTLIAMFGIVRAGGVAVLANYSMPAEHLQYLLNYTDVKYIAYGLNRDTYKKTHAAEELAGSCGQCEGIYDIWSIDFLKRIRQGEQAQELPIELSKDSTSDAIIIFTTGTTEVPKAVVLSQESILTSASGWWDRVYDAVTYDKICIALPLFHSFGLTLAMGFLLASKQLYIIDKLDPDIIMSTIDKYEIDYIGSVGLLYLGMLRSPKFKTMVAPYVKACIVGGEFTLPEHIVKIDECYPDVKFFIGYGQTEASPVISLSHPYDSIEKRAYTIGKPLSCLEVKIMGEDNTEVPQGIIGEIWAKGDSLMKGYYKVAPEKQAIDAQGWLHTGDLGCFDEDGYLKITGRKKDIIIKAGENISPIEIERALKSCEGIKSAKVIGVPDVLYGEEIAACLTLMEGYRFSQNKLKEQLTGVISNFKMPKEYFVFDAFPLHENGKINMRLLKNKVQERRKKHD